jgi:hypothetical protein
MAVLPQSIPASKTERIDAQAQQVAPAQIAESD